MTATAISEVRGALHRSVPDRNPQSEYPVPPGRRTGRLWDALREVMDPEIPVSLVDLGLIYDVRLHHGTAAVDLTFTATACPCVHFIKWDIAERLQAEAGVEDVAINEVWNPPWSKSRITPEGRRQMKEMGITV